MISEYFNSRDSLFLFLSLSPSLPPSLFLPCVIHSAVDINTYAKVRHELLRDWFFMVYDSGQYVSIRMRVCVRGR